MGNCQNGATKEHEVTRRGTVTLNKNEAKAEKEFNNLFKFLVLGESGVGKTALTCRYVDGNFDDNILSTIGVDFKIKTIDQPDGKKYRIQIWDTAGQERYRSISSTYYRSVSGIIIVFDLTKKDTFDLINSRWLDEMQNNVEDGVLQRIPKILIGNKCDMKIRAVQTAEGEALAQKIGAEYFECSAKDNINVEDAFASLINSSIKVHSQ